MKADAQAAFRAALAAADPGQRVSRWLEAHAEAGRPEGRLAVIAIGKAACAMAAGALAVRDTDPGNVLVITKEGHGNGCGAGLQVLECGHPTPDRRSLTAGEAVLERAQDLGPADELLLLVSGGSSALVEALPPEIPCDDWFAANDALVGGGRPIQAVNAVRKHCSRLKGGRLAEAAAPARVTALLLSDVIGDDPAVIGSGPAAPDPSTFDEALEAIDGLSHVPDSIRDYLEGGKAGAISETPKPGALADVCNVVVGNNRSALEAAGHELAQLGYQPLPMTSRMQGEAKEVARVLAAVGLESRAASQPAAAPVAFLWGGETTVTLGPTPGEGGRNQEMALAMAGDLDGEPGIGALCAGTDGTDGPTNAAGGWVDGTTCQRIADAGCSVEQALAYHDSGSALASLGDRLVTGPTGTNVMDLALVLVAEQG
ncbi:MAG: glycerate kinase [Thiohalorhabdaceae bacterium]